VQNFFFRLKKGMLLFKNMDKIYIKICIITTTEYIIKTAGQFMPTLILGVPLNITIERQP